MFILAKIISRLLFPLALVIELLIAGLVLIRTRFRRLGYSLCATAFLFLVSASLNPVADMFLWTLERRYVPIGRIGSELKIKIKYAVVLGSGHSERGDLSPMARLSPSGIQRVIEALRLSRELPGVHFIFTGGTIRGKMAIGEAASLAAITYGLPPSRIIVERTARNTEEEVQAVSRIIKDKRIVLVTDASHMRRALGLFQAAGFQVVPAPVGFSAMDGIYSPWDFVPSADALQKTERAWYEYLGLAWNAIRGINEK